VKDPNKPELEGKIMVLKFGRKVNDLIEQQIKPEFGNPSNPYDLFEGKNFGLHVRKVGEWNNYDLCQFVGDKGPISIEGSPVEKTEESREAITTYLKTGPLDLEKYDYKDWSEEDSEKIMRIIRNTIPDGRLVSEIIGENSDSKSTPSASTSNVDSFFEEANDRSSTTKETKPKETKATKPKASPSLDDLYNDL
jgi:hypothetical protein